MSDSQNFEETPLPSDPLDGLIERVQVDVAAAYTGGVIKAAAELRRHNPGKFVELLRDLKALKHATPKVAFSATIFNQLVDKEFATSSLIVAEQDIATLLVKLSLTAKQHFLDADTQNVFADFEIVVDGVTYPTTGAVHGRAYQRWLEMLFYEKYERAAPREALKSAIHTIEARTFAAKKAFRLFPRIAQVKDADENAVIYLDRGSATGEAFRIDHNGYELVDDPPVKFIRPESGVGELPIPERGGKIDDLESMLNLRGRRDFVLGIGWALGCYQPTSPLLQALLLGRHGSAKTSAMRRFCALVDPIHGEPLEPVREDREVVIVAQTTYVQPYDNTTRISPSRSATYCRLSTGGSQRGRVLYTTLDSYSIHARRPLIQTATRMVVNEPDLIDRTVLIGMGPPFEEENASKRKMERTLDAAFNKVWPKLFGCILDAVVEGMRRQKAGEPVPENLPRMADFAGWTYLCEPGLGWAQGTILQAYREAIEEYARDIAELDSIAAAIMAFMLDQPDGWRGSITMLMAQLSRQDGGRAQRGRSWSWDLKDLSAAVDELASVLFRNGLRIARGHSGGKREVIMEWLPSARPNGKDSAPAEPGAARPTSDAPPAWRPRP